MRTIKGIVSLTRPYVLLTTTSFYIAAAFLSINGIPPLIPSLIGFLAVALAIASAHTLNDYFDRESDQTNPRTARRAIPSGVVKPRLALALGTLYGVTAISLTLLLNLFCIILAIIAIPLPFAYNFMRKRHIPFSFLCTMLAVFFIIMFGSATASGMYLPNYIPIFIVFGVSWEMGRTLISEVQDVDSDRETKVTTISVTISPKRAAQLILVLFSIASITTIGIGILGQFGIIYLALAFGVSIWLIYRCLGLVRSPSTSNAIDMLYRAPRYLVIICLILILTTVMNTLLFLI